MCPASARRLNHDDGKELSNYTENAEPSAERSTDAGVAGHRKYLEIISRALNAKDK